MYLKHSIERSAPVKKTGQKCIVFVTMIFSLENRYRYQSPTKRWWSSVLIVRQERKHEVCVSVSIFIDRAWAKIWVCRCRSLIVFFAYAWWPPNRSGCNVTLPGLYTSQMRPQSKKSTRLWTSVRRQHTPDLGLEGQDDEFVKDFCW